MIPRCPHGVYDPHGDQGYCSVCNPIPVQDTALMDTPIGKIGDLRAPEYDLEWEKKLDMAVLKPEEEEEFVPTPDENIRANVYKSSDNHPDLEQLREKFDGSDFFMSSGHQIIKIRSQARKIPERMQTIEGMKEVLEESFPNWKTNIKQRQRLSRWLSVAYLSYRVGLSQTQVAAETRLQPDTVKSILKRLRRVSMGIRANNTGLKKT